MKTHLPKSVVESGIYRCDWSGLSTILECSRAGWNKLVIRRVIGEYNPALGFGGAVHAALDFRQKCGSGELDPVDRQTIDGVIARRFQGVKIDDDEYRDEGRAKEVVGLYLERYPVEPFEILASELSREKLLGHVVVNGQPVEIIWQGKTDGIWQDLRDRRCAVKDTKHTREATLERKEQEFYMSPQLRMYCWLFSGGEYGEILDAVVDLIIVRKPLVRPTSKSLPRNEFHRIPLRFTSSLIEETKRDVLVSIGRWLNACAGPYPPPMDGAPRQCVWHNGKQVCPYLQVCENGTEEARMKWLMSSQFVDYEWDPMKG